MDGRDKENGLYDDNTRAVDERLRLYTTAALNENVKAVFTVEVDYTWGDTGVGKIGADQKGQIEIANLYLDFNVPEANTNVKAGTHYFKMGGGLILGEHSSGVSIRKAFSENVNLGLYWVKAVEGAAADDSQDIDYYQAQIDLKVGGMTVTPLLGYLDADDGTAMNDENEQYYYGLELKGKADALDFGLVAVYNDGRVNGANNDALALIANAGVTMGATKLVFEAGRYGDSDNPNGEMVTVAGYNNFSEILTGGYFDVRSVGGGGVDTSVTAHTNTGAVATGNNSYYMNYLYGKVGVEQKVHEKGKLRAYYIYAKEAADVSNRTVTGGVGHKRITFGHEIDAYYDYTVVPGLVMTVGGGYLLADDDYGYGKDANGSDLGGDDAWKAGLGLAYKF
jgi:hypothetical protein